MIVDSPVRGAIHVNADNYPTHPDAWKRPAGNHEAAVSHDFGPSSVEDEPTVVWPGGEADIFGRQIPKGTYANFHLGIDIGHAGCGFDVLAAKAGKVTSSGRNASGAEVIIIDHGQGFATRYAHMSKRLVSLNAVVTAGQRIGLTGSTGALSTGCHLHFAITKDGEPVDAWRRLAQNTTIDPDQEADVPVLSSYIPGQTARISNAVGDVNVRAEPRVAGTVLRQIPKGTTETWAVTGWVKGDLTVGSDQWLTRWNGAWEYVHKSNVAAGPTAIAVDCTVPVKVAHDAGYAEAKAKAGAAVSGI